VKPIAVIDILSPCTSWKQVCLDAERLARGSARAALIEGIAALGLAFPEQAELGITLTDDAEQRQLNHRYRGRDEATNVLAFSTWEPGTQLPTGAPMLLGDVVLAFETVLREANAQAKPFADHLSHLVVHGVLHLLGCDHREKVEAAAMERLETTILAKLGIPDPYRDIEQSIELEHVCP
jgi:probable rRNA maturation factor